MDKVAKRRKDKQEKRNRKDIENASIYLSEKNHQEFINRNNKKNYKNSKRKKERDTKKINNIRVRKKIKNKKTFKGYYILLIIAILFLLITIITGNKKDDVSRYLYFNNEKIKTINPIKISLAKNSTAKVAVLSLDDIREIFDKNIRYNNEEKEIITIGKTHVARIILNDYAINLNGTDSVINVSVSERDGKIYLPLNDLSSVYGIEVFISENDKVIVDDVHKSKKIVKVEDKTKLKKNKKIFSKTIIKVSDQEDLILVEEGKRKLKVRTFKGEFGYIPVKKVKTIVEVRSNYNEDENREYNIIRNYSNPDDNYDKVQKQGEFNAAIVDIFKISLNNEKNKLILSQKYENDNSSYKIYRDKLKTNNIETIGQINLKEFDLLKYLDKFIKRQNFISELLKISNKHNFNAIELIVSDNIDIKIYEEFVEELKPRLKERGLKLFIPKDKIKTDKIKENIDYES